MKKILIILIISYLFIPNTFAQQAILKGKVTLQNGGESVPGAVIQIISLQKGTGSDFDGNYSIINLPEGKYEVSCKYISHKTEMKTVSIQENSETVINFVLEEDILNIAEVQIEARAIQNTSNSMIIHQKNTSALINGISSQEISAYGDNNAAASLSRVSGINVSEGKYIYVRGLGDRYSKTDVNGTEIPSLDPEKNTVQMDLFPSNIIDNILVYKTFSPQLPANFTGGYVNIITREFPDKLSINYSSSIGIINPQSNLNRNFLTYKGGKLDYLGYDDGTRNIPALAQEGIPFRYTNDALLNQVSESFGNNMHPERNMSSINQSQSLSFGNTIKAGKREIGFLLSGSFGKSYQYYENGINGNYLLTRSEAPYLQKNLIYNDTKGSEKAIAGLLANTSLKINKNNKIAINLIYNHAGDKLARYQEGRNYYHEVNMQTRTMQFTERDFWATQLKGNSVLQNLFNMKINWISAYSVAKQDEPDLRFFTNIYEIFGEDTVYSIDAAKQDLPARYYRDMFENSLNNKIDFEIPIGENSKIAFGIYNIIKTRSFREKLFVYADNNNSYAGNLEAYLSSDNIGTNAINTSGSFGVYIKDNTQTSNSYDGSMNIYSSYLMGEFNINSNLKIETGVRAEKSYISVVSMNAFNPEGKINNIDILPALNATYQLSEKINIKTAYSKTIARPSFRELAPYASFEFMGDFIFVGNENLQETKTDNVDIRAEYYRGAGQIISLGYFYKRFRNPIERTFNPAAANNELTLQNAETANVHGLEAEIRLKPAKEGMFSKFMVGGNFTYVNSIVAINEDELNAIRATNLLQAPSREMYGQAPYIINAFLIFDNKKTGTQANFTYNISGDKLAIVVKGGTPDIYEKARNQADFNFSQKLGEKFSLKISVSNILNSAYSKTYTYQNTEYYHSSYKIGQTYGIGIKYILN